MSLSTLNAVSPIDGRYHRQTAVLSPYFSEFGLIRYRVLVEIEYLIALNGLNLKGFTSLSEHEIDQLNELAASFSEVDAAEIKEIEKTTNHDVKAVEYFLKSRLEKIAPAFNTEFIHFGLTSQDINNTAVPLSIMSFLEDVYFPKMQDVISVLEEKAEEWESVSMLARTHGQPASPTRLGKELMVFVERLSRQLELLAETPMGSKFGGATGNFNAHHAAYPDVDWHAFADEFVQEKLGLTRYRFTTQIEHYDYLAAQFDGMKRINTILIDFCRDIWHYISIEYFRQKIKANEVGSSAMPHKVNPIDFENAEGNLGISNAILEHLSAKLPISRLQRDLTDSTVLRNVGVPAGHWMIAVNSILKGFDKLLLNEKALAEDLENNWAVVAEGIQTILRREGFPKPYEALKALTRTGEAITKTAIQNFIDDLAVSDEVKQELKQLSPATYTGPEA